MNIIEGGLAAHSVYRDEAAHLAAGESYGIDLCNEYGVGWTAPLDCTVVPGTGCDPDNGRGFHAGFVTVIQCYFKDRFYRLHYCHGQANEVKIGQTLAAGQVFGHVGSSGTTIDRQGQRGTIEAAHLHFWAACEEANGWERVQDVQGLLAELEAAGSEDDMDAKVVEFVGNQIWDVREWLNAKKRKTVKDRDAIAKLLAAVQVIKGEIPVPE